MRQLAYTLARQTVGQLGPLPDCADAHTGVLRIFWLSFQQLAALCLFTCCHYSPTQVEPCGCIVSPVSKVLLCHSLS